MVRILDILRTVLDDGPTFHLTVNRREAAVAAIASLKRPLPPRFSLQPKVPTRRLVGKYRYAYESLKPFRPVGVR